MEYKDHIDGNDLVMYRPNGYGGYEMFAVSLDGIYELYEDHEDWEEVE